MNLREKILDCLQRNPGGLSCDELVPMLLIYSKGILACHLAALYQKGKVRHLGNGVFSVSIPA